jgi:hypothetical protein
MSELIPTYFEVVTEGELNIKQTLHIPVTIYDANLGIPLGEGIPIELYKGFDLLATANTNSDGFVKFYVTETVIGSYIYGVNFNGNETYDSSYYELSPITFVNDSPAFITTSPISVNEGDNSFIITASDLDSLDYLTWSFANGDGDTDNNLFYINQNMTDVYRYATFVLEEDKIFNYEEKNSYSIRISVTDYTATAEQAFIINVTNINETPIITSSDTVNVDDGQSGFKFHQIVVIDSENDYLTFSLPEGYGDNSYFMIDNSIFKGFLVHISGENIVPFSYQTKSSYNIKVEVTDGQNIANQIITITVNPPSPSNSAPTIITTSPITVEEGNNSVVFTASDTDGNNLTWSLVSGSGDTDNASFTMGPTGILTINSGNFNFENKQSYSVRVNVNDGTVDVSGSFTITITNVNEIPTDISLSASSIAENNSTNAIIGTLSTTDPDSSNTFTYTLVSGSGDTDNASFNINANQLRASIVFNYENKSSYSIRIRSTDQGGLFYEKQFTITITNVDETDNNQINGDILSRLTSNTFSIDLDKNGIITEPEIIQFNNKFIKLNVQYQNTNYINLIRDIHRNEIKKI